MIIWPRVRAVIEGAGSFEPKAVEVSGSCEDNDSRARIEFSTMTIKPSPIEPQTEPYRLTKRVIVFPSPAEEAELEEKINEIELRLAIYGKGPKAEEYREVVERYGEQALREMELAKEKSEPEVRQEGARPALTPLVGEGLLSEEERRRLQEARESQKNVLGWAADIGWARVELAKRFMVYEEQERAERVRIAEELEAHASVEFPQYKELYERNPMELPKRVKRWAHTKNTLVRIAELQQQYKALKDRLKSRVEERLAERGVRVIDPGREVVIYGWYNGYPEWIIFRGYLTKVRLENTLTLVCRPDWPLTQTRLKLWMGRVKAYEWVQRLIKNAGITDSVVDRAALGFTLEHAVATKDQTTLDVLNRLRERAEKELAHRHGIDEASFPFWFDCAGRFNWLVQPSGEPAFKFAYAKNISRLRVKDRGRIEVETVFFPYISWGETVRIEHPAASGDYLITRLIHRYQRGNCRTVMTLEPAEAA